MEPYLSTWIRCLIGLVFLVSAVSKVRGRQSFADFAAAVEALAPVPGARRLLAPAVVALEFAVCGLLIAPLPGAFRYGAWLATGLLLAFAVGIAFAVWRGQATACRCFGASATPVSAWQAVRNLALAVPAGVAALVGPGSGGTTGAVALTIVIGLVCGALVTVLDELVELFLPGTGTAASPATMPTAIRQEKHRAPRDRRPRLRRGVVHPQPRAEPRHHQASAGPGRDPQPRRQL
ncbi:MauE/DoxX family redox-associated membrane protein [Streptomyces sp. NBC_00076]|uniref:MauE/DoxX family redox-associated membrane protein n=1 Tax=Streptomyces sp. NBC_00076 TaxID=2975642 RepID=UPI003869C465